MYTPNMEASQGTGLNLMGSSYDQPADALNFSQLQEIAFNEHIAKLEDLIQVQKNDIEQMSAEDLKNHQLPLARVKKIMKSDEDVRMISAEAPALFGKACELFIIELTHRAWIYTEESKRRTLQRSDIGTCIERTDIYDFLQDIVPTDSQR